jgi:hypothetical protein
MIFPPVLFFDRGIHRLGHAAPAVSSRHPSDDCAGDGPDWAPERRTDRPARYCAAGCAHACADRMRPWLTRQRIAILFCCCFRFVVHNFGSPSDSFIASTRNRRMDVTISGFIIFDEARSATACSNPMLWI